MRADRWRSHGRLETRLIAPTLTNASKRLWLDADEQVPAVPLSHPATGRPNAAVLGGHMCRWPFGIRDARAYRNR